MKPIFMLEGSSADALVPWHYGDPLRETNTFVNDQACVDLSHFGVVTVSGADRLSWLHTLTTQWIDENTGSAQALILSPHGHIEYDLHVIDYADQSWLITEPETAQALTEYLRSMQFMLRVNVDDVSTDFAVVGISGWVANPDLPTWHSPKEYSESAAYAYVAGRPHSWQVTQVIVPRAELATFLRDKPLVGIWAWEAARIRAGIPRLGYETDHKTIAHEVGLITTAVHLNKGCYRGQETVARVFNLGKPPRRLVQLEIDGSTNELPGRNAVITLDGVAVGRLTSICQDFEHGPLGLGVVKRTVPSDAVLEIELEEGSVPAAQTAIVN